MVNWETCRDWFWFRQTRLDLIKNQKYHLKQLIQLDENHWKGNSKFTNKTEGPKRIEIVM